MPLLPDGVASANNLVSQAAGGFGIPEDECELWLIGWDTVKWDAFYGMSRANDSDCVLLHNNEPLDRSASLAQLLMRRTDCDNISVIVNQGGARVEMASWAGTEQPLPWLELVLRSKPQPSVSTSSPAFQERCAHWFGIAASLAESVGADSVLCIAFGSRVTIWRA